MLKLREYHPQQIALEPSEVAELGRMVKGAGGTEGAPRVIEQLIPTGQDGHYLIQPGPYVGRFTLATGRVVDITSRFKFTDILEVLRTAGHLPALLRDSPTPSHDDHGLLDLIATAFARECKKIIGFGLVKGYEARTFTRPPYPGVLDATAHLARYQGRADRLITRAKRLTTDVPVNQVLAAAHRVLRIQTYSDRAISLQLRSLGPAFSNMTRVSNALRVADQVRRSVPDRYAAAFALAVVTLLGHTALPADGDTPGASVLFNMTQVWESYVEAWLKGRLPEGHRLASQHPITLTDGVSPMQAKADFVVLDQRGETVKVYDAKYKHWAPKPTVDDLYQMITYAYRLGLDRATLLYPGHGERAEVTIGRYRIAMVGIDVLQRAHTPLSFDCGI